MCVRPRPRGFGCAGSAHKGGTAKPCLAVACMWQQSKRTHDNMSQLCAFELEPASLLALLRIRYKGCMHDWIHGHALPRMQRPVT